MRIALATLLSVASAVVLCACGSGGGHAATRTSARAQTAAPPERAPTVAEATAFAKAINIDATDVPGLKAAPKQPEHETLSERRLRQKLHGCIGNTAGGNVVHVSSPEFKRAVGPFSESVSSDVSVERSPAIAERELKALRTHDVRACLTQYVDQSLKSHHYGHVTVAPVSVAEGSPPAPGTTGSFGWRITSGLELRGIRIPFYMDILGFVSGPAEVSLESFGIPRAFPARAQEQLFTLLVQRAAAQHR